MLIHYSSVPKNPFKSAYSRKKPQGIGLKTWDWLRVKFIVCGISWSELEKEWNLQEWSTKKALSLGVSFFGLGVFKGCDTLLRNHTCYDLPVFQNFQDKPRNFSGVYTKTFSKPPCLLFSLEQTTDRQIDLLLWVLKILCPLHWPRSSFWTSAK